MMVPNVRFVLLIEFKLILIFCIRLFTYLVLYMDNIPTWMAFLLSFLFGTAGAILVQCFVVPWQRKKVLDQIKATTNPVTFTFDGSNGNYF